MIEFNCTVKDIFRRPNMIDKAVRRLADNGFAEHAVIYARVRDNLFNALAYASEHMKPHEYEAAVGYLGSRQSEQAIADISFYNHRTIRRYVSKVCDLVGKYYAEFLGISLLPNDTRNIKCEVSTGSFWEKVNSLMNGSIENACIVISYCFEHSSINAICSTYNMGGEKVKRIVNTFNSVVTVYDIPSESRSAV